MKKSKKFLAIIVGSILVVASPVSVLAWTASGPSNCCGSGTNQITGGYTYHGSSSHMYWANICYFTYDQDVTYRKCVVCSNSTTWYGDRYNEKHSLH